MKKALLYGQLAALFAILILTKITIVDDFWSGVIVEAVFFAAGLLMVSKTTNS